MNGTHYVIDGLEYPRITTIISVLRKPGLERWRGKVGNDAADKRSHESTEFGTRLHEACHLVNLGELVDCDADLDQHVSAYADWFAASVAAVIGAERQVVSRRHRFAGTADLIAEMRDGSRAVIDLKTSASCGHDYRLQLSAYQLALEEDGIQAERRLIVRLPRQEPGALYVHEFDRCDEDREAFMACLALWQWDHAHKDDWRAEQSSYQRNNTPSCRDCGRPSPRWATPCLTCAAVPVALVS